MKNVMILVGKLEINGKLFSMQDSEGTVYATQLGLQDDFYGGAVREFRKTKYGIFMCVDRAERVINLAYTEESLTDEGRKLLFPDDAEIISPFTEPWMLAMEDEPYPMVKPLKNTVEVKKESVVSVKNSKPKAKSRTISHKKKVTVNAPEKIEEQKSDEPEHPDVDARGKKAEPSSGNSLQCGW